MKFPETTDSDLDPRSLYHFHRSHSEEELPVRYGSGYTLLKGEKKSHHFLQ